MLSKRLSDLVVDWFLAKQADGKAVAAEEALFDFVLQHRLIEVKKEVVDGKT